MKHVSLTRAQLNFPDGQDLRLALQTKKTPTWGNPTRIHLGPIRLFHTGQRKIQIYYNKNMSYRTAIRTKKFLRPRHRSHFFRFRFHNDSRTTHREKCIRNSHGP